VSQLIALLAVLGVNLIVLVAFGVIVLGRERWVKRQPGAFRGVIRVASGDRRPLTEMAARLRTLGPRVLAWTKAPFLFRNELIPTDRLDERDPARQVHDRRGRGSVSAATAASRHRGLFRSAAAPVHRRHDQSRRGRPRPARARPRHTAGMKSSRSGPVWIAGASRRPLASVGEDRRGDHE
jgi:hypothetical protein